MVAAPTAVFQLPVVLLTDIERSPIATFETPLEFEPKESLPIATFKFPDVSIFKPPIFPAAKLVKPDPSPTKAVAETVFVTLRLVIETVLLLYDIPWVEEE